MMALSFPFAQYLLGIEGVALLRSWLVNKEEAEKRLEDVINICGSLNQAPQATNIVVDTFTPLEGYSSWSTQYDQEDERNPLMELEAPILQCMLAAIPPGKALDAACGTGRQTRRLLELGHDVTGVDLTPGMLHQAVRRNPQADFIRADLRTLPLEDNSFDIAICSLALTHIPDVTRPIKEIARVTRPGGQIILSDIHPIQILALGGHAHFPLEQNHLGRVHNYVHLHSTYLQAFAQSYLTVHDCVEPVYTPETVALLPAAPFIPDANSAAFNGVPALLIWKLQKQA
jgi:ubiquinone/menaquinone biosynthesis C-methylase UbiE